MRPAHVTRDGRVICSVKGCGFLIIQHGRNALNPSDLRQFDTA
jgi:hypothetical protein